MTVSACGFRRRVAYMSELTEGDRKAYFETSQWTIRQKKETIAAIKRENKELRQHLAQLHSEQKRNQNGATYGGVRSNT